jgi:outer membrane protein assembly factor BamB
MKPLYRFALAGLFLSLCTRESYAAAPTNSRKLDWSQFRGPDRSGSVPGAQNFDFSNGQRLKILWKKQVSTGGYSQMIVCADKAYTMLSNGTDDFAVCLDAATGDEIWRVKVASTLYLPGNADPGPLSTPAVDESAAYFLTAEGHFFALNAQTGGRIWKTDAVREIGGVRPYHGYSTSPLVHGNRVYLQVGGPKKAMVAFDKRSGKILWDVHPEPNNYSSTNYASPNILTAGGVEQVLFKTKSYLTSAAVVDGKILWKQSLSGDPFATPMLLPNERIFVAGMNQGTLLKVEEGKTHVLWQSNKLRGNYSEPVFIDGHFYGYSSSFLACVDVKTGNEMWKSRDPGDGSLAYAGGYLLLLTSKGKLFVLEPNPAKYKEITSLQVIEGRTLTEPAVAQGKLFLRNLRDIACVTVER